MEYVLEYGKYKLVNNMLDCLFANLIFSLWGVGFIVFFMYLIVSEVSDDVQSFLCKHKKKIIGVIISVICFYCLLPIVQELAAYKASPAAYSVRAVQQDFLKKTKK